MCEEGGINNVVIKRGEGVFGMKFKTHPRVEKARKEKKMYIIKKIDADKYLVEKYYWTSTKANALAFETRADALKYCIDHSIYTWTVDIVTR